MQNRQTIWKLAGEANVDPRTVARVLRGESSHASTRRVIEAAAKRLKVDIEPAPATPALSAPSAPSEAA